MVIRQQWDIFCRVVDNLGDAGVCWRLARQLAVEHGLSVRLWIDDLHSLKTLLPEINTGLSKQSLSGVEIALWQPAFPVVAPAQVVIEAFACELPDVYIQAMAAQGVKPVWINLEYLSAEPWVKGCHGLASPHPTLPLTKHFFFPGFEAGTGGLLRERGLFQARDDFSADTEARAQFWRTLGTQQPEPGQTQISLFCYDHSPIAALFEAWAKGEQAIRCLVPPGKPLAAVRRYFGDQGTSWYVGQLTVEAIPFLLQPDYDHLLWACDLNFVRGEDSFVRAQWAGKPMVWHIYPQDEKAHLDKLRAFMAVSALPEAQANFLLAWNTGVDVDSAWRDWEANFAESCHHASDWAHTLEKQTDLAGSLVSFASGLL